MFIENMADLADLVVKHQVNFHSFADDSHILSSLSNQRGICGQQT